MPNEPTPPAVAGFGRVVRSVRRDLPLRLLKIIVRPGTVDAVRDAVNGAGVPGLTITEVRWVGKPAGQAAVYRGQSYQRSIFPRLELETVVPEHLRAAVTAEIITAARSGQSDDGSVLVLPIERSYRIRTGELDPV